jgi:acetylornithine deacetylase/succinyl-diaminopimelate desuccinylase-like protein
MSATIELLRELIALPSVNPAFLPDREELTGERRVADYLAANASKAGLAIEFQEVLPGRSNVLARYEPSGPVRQRILLAPHLDTVGGTPCSEALFTPRQKNGRLHGRGACDTKGSAAALFTALTRITKTRQRPRHTAIVFAGLVDEEHEQLGSRFLAARGFKADLAIVGEPTRLEVVTAHKGDLWLQLETRGKSAHGARPDLGRNAVHTMCRVVHLLETEYAAALRRRGHPLLGHATVSVGSIHGGTQPNVVPAQCASQIDRRTLPGETEAGVVREIKALLRRRRLVARLVNSKRAPCLPLETDPRLPLIQQFFRSVGRRRPAGVHFFCDASVLAHGGIPSLVFGPGDIAQAHTQDEWVSLAALDRATELLTRFLVSLP